MAWSFSASKPASVKSTVSRTANGTARIIQSATTSTVPEPRPAGAPAPVCVWTGRGRRLALRRRPPEGRRPALARRLDGVLAWARPGGGAGRIDEARGSGARKVVRVSYVRLKRLFTRIHFADETMNGSDPILALVPPERRHTLMATPDATRGGVFRFEIRLQGQGETVFFDA
jgi:hypothetical protein